MNELYKHLNDALDALEGGDLREVAAALLAASHAADVAADTARAEGEQTAWTYRRRLMVIQGGAA
jgi:hypothetical protein